MSAPPYHPNMSLPGGQPPEPQPYYTIPEAPPSPVQAVYQSKPNVETFKRRVLPIFPMILAILHPIAINLFVVEKMTVNSNTVLLIVGPLSVLFWIYSVVFLMAPRFMYRGLIWLKTSPWLLAGLGMSAVFVAFEILDIWRIIYVCLASILQITQYVIFVIPKNVSLTFALKPFERQIVPNMLAKFQLGDPNANLDACFGPSIVLPSNNASKGPVLVRYGSQAVSNLAPQIPTQNGQQAPHTQFVPPPEVAFPSNYQSSPPQFPQSYHQEDQKQPSYQDQQPPQYIQSDSYQEYQHTEKK